MCKADAVPALLDVSSILSALEVTDTEGGLEGRECWVQDPGTLKGTASTGKNWGGKIQTSETPRASSSCSTSHTGLLRCCPGTPQAARPCPRMLQATPSRQSGKAPQLCLGPLSLLASLFLKAASPISLASWARNLKVIPTLPAPSSAIPNLSARSAVPWKCHSSAPPLSPQPLFWHNTPLPKNLQRLPAACCLSLSLFSLDFKVLLNPISSTYPPLGLE